MLPVDKTNNPIIIQDSSKSKFCEKIEKLLLSPPEWVSQHVQAVRQTLNAIPPEMGINYNYAPTYSYNDFQIQFECTTNKYKLTLKKEETSIILQKHSSSKVNAEKGNELQEKKQQEKTIEVPIENKIVYSGPVTSASVNQFPRNLQAHASKLAQNDSHYTTTINSNGNVTVGGGVSIKGETMDYMDFLKTMENQKNTST